MRRANITSEVRTQADFLAWLSAGDLRGVTELSLWSAELDDAAAAAIASHPDARELRALDLSHNHVGPDGAEALARSLPQLQHLRLYHNTVGTRGAAAIAAAPWRLVSLNLCGNALGPDGVAALRGPAASHVESLHLGWDQLGDEGALGLSSGEWPRLAELNVRSNELTPAGIAPLLRGGLPRLTRLGVDDNRLGDAGLAELLDAPGFRRLTWLNLTATELTERALSLLAGADTSNLRELRIGGNAVSEAAVDALPSLARCDVTERSWEVVVSIQQRGAARDHVETLRGKSFSFGRAEDNTVVLKRDNVSRRHFEIRVDKLGRAIGVDGGSSNGTFINGEKMSGPTPLTPEDRVMVGDFVVRLVEMPR